MMKGKRIAQLEAQVAVLHRELESRKVSLALVEHLISSCETIDQLRHCLLDAQIATSLGVSPQDIVNNIILRTDTP